MKKDRLAELLRVVMASAPEEIDCDQFLERVAALLETVGADGNIPPELSAVSQHLEVCPECKEEFDALLELYRRQEP